MAAELADEATARAKRTGNASDHQMRLWHPMQRGIGEHRIELGDEIQGMAVDFADSEAFHPRHREQLIAQVDAENVGAGGLDFGSEHAVAAAKIEDALAGLGTKHPEHGARQLLHEAAVPRIVGRRPTLNGLRQRCVEKPLSPHCGCHGS